MSGDGLAELEIEIGEALKALALEVDLAHRLDGDTKMDARIEARKRIMDVVRPIVEAREKAMDELSLWHSPDGVDALIERSQGRGAFENITTGRDVAITRAYFTLEASR